MLCSSWACQESYGLSGGIPIATAAWAYGSGYDVLSGTPLATYRGDANSDGKMTIYEVNCDAVQTLFGNQCPGALLTPAIPDDKEQIPTYYSSNTTDYVFW